MSDVLIIGDGPLAEEMAARVAQAGYATTAYLPDIEQPQGSLATYLDEFPGPYNLVVEAYIADQERKQRAMLLASKYRKPGALMLTATLNASATEVGAWMGGNAADVVGWSALPPLNDVVEVMPGMRTKADSTTGAVRFFEGLGMEPVVVRDAVGGVLPRVVANLINGAAFALMEDIASAKDIDRAMVLGTNYPHGPLEWGDRIGLDQVVGILDGLARVHDPSQYRAAPLLRHMVMCGQWGERTGKGFFEY